MELEAGVQAAQAFGVRLAELRLVEVEIDGHVGLDRHKRLGEPGHVAAGAQVLLALLARDIIGVRQHLLQAAELLHEGRGRLLADAGDPGHVVRGVAGQAEHVGDLLGRHAESLDDLILGEAFFAVLVIDGDSAGAVFTQPLVYNTSIVSEYAVHKSQIYLVDGSLGKLPADKALRARILSKDYYAAGVFVQAVDDSHFLLIDFCQHYA